MTSRSMATYVGASAVKKAFIFEVPNFMQELELLARSCIDRRVSSEDFEFQGFKYKFIGCINIEMKNAILEITATLSPGVIRVPYGNDFYGTHDSESTLDATLECEGSQLKYFKHCTSYGGLTGRPSYQTHRCSVSMTLDDLKNAVPEHLLDHVNLRVKTTWTVFGELKSSKWVETSENSSGPEIKLPPLPFVRHLQDRKHSDLVVECDGKEFPVHSVVLKCTSPVFTAMLSTDMKEAASGRIKIEDVGVAAVEQMLDFIYIGKISLHGDQSNALSDDLIVELLHCSEKYEIPEMKQPLFCQLRAKVSTRNAIKFLKAAELYGAEENLVKEIQEFCKKNFFELPKCAELQEFVGNYLRDQL